MLICQRCGKELQQGAIICRNCGQRVLTQQEQPVKTEHPQRKEKRKVETETVEKVEEPLLDDGSSTDTSESATGVSTGWFILMELLMMIPCLNIVMLVVWMRSKNNATRKHYATAKLIMMIVGSIIVAVLYFTVFATVIGSLSSLMY